MDGTGRKDMNMINVKVKVRDPIMNHCEYECGVQATHMVLYRLVADPESLDGLPVRRVLGYYCATDARTEAERMADYPEYGGSFELDDEKFPNHYDEEDGMPLWEEVTEIPGGINVFEMVWIEKIEDMSKYKILSIGGKSTGILPEK